MRKREVLFSSTIGVLLILSLLALPRFLAPSPVPLDLNTKSKMPPAPMIAFGKTAIPWVQASYCWRGCGEYIVGKQMMNEKKPTIVPAGARIQADYNYDPAPTVIVLEQLGEDSRQMNQKKPVLVPLQNGKFTAPSTKGTYYYLLGAYWIQENTQYSLGDTSAVFAIEVR
ncbi:hypothetical protein [Paenibacillus sp. Z6-24]